VLGLTDRASGVALDRAVKKLHDSPVPDMSQATVEQTREVLALVQDALANSTRGRGTLAESVSVPASLALGIAAVLCDSPGEADRAQALQLLQQRTGANMRDAAVIAARAHFASAKAALASTATTSAAPPAAVAYDHLRSASQALASAGSPPPAPRLAADISALMQETVPAAARDVLTHSRTTGDAAGRASAVQAVQGLMRSGDVSAEYITRLLPHLTCKEAVAMLSWTCDAAAPRGVRVAPHVLKAAASGMLAAALLERQPALAETVFRSPQLQTGPPDRFAPERAVSALLLAEPRAAIDVLIAAAGSSSQSNAATALLSLSGCTDVGSAVQSVKAMDRDELLAGMCTWAEEWLRACPLAEWTDTAPVANTGDALLVPYFDDAGVADYLRRRGKSVQRGIVGAAVTQLLALPARVLSLVNRGSGKEEAETAPAPPPMPMPVTAAQRAAAAVAADKAAKLVAVTDVPVTAPRPRYDNVVGLIPPSGPTLADGGAASKPKIRMTVPTSPQPLPKQPARPVVDQAAPANAGDVTAADKPTVSYAELMRRKRERDGATAPSKPPAPAPPAVTSLEEAASASPTARRARAVLQDIFPANAEQAADAKPYGLAMRSQATALTALAMLFSAAVLLARGGHIRLRLPPLPTPRAETAAATSTKNVAPEKNVTARPWSGHGHISSARDAERLIRDWQRVKSLAMGSSHEVDALARVCGGPLLEEWRSRAQSAVKSGFAWRFRLRRIKVVRIVGGTPRGAPAAVEAVIRERGSLHDEREASSEVDLYDEAYTVRYLMEDVDGSGYRITRAAVIDAAGTTKE